MKKFTLTMSRTYQTIFEIEAENESEALNKLEQMEDRYAVELEQCCVINEQIECTEENA
jgi:riboflavin synthase alpha subunit